MRFDLKLAWIFMTGACVLVWASMGESIIPPIMFLVFAGFAGASYAAIKGASPLFWGVVTGPLAVGLLVICVIPVRAAIYLMPTAPPADSEELFEDGIEVVFFTYPIVYSPVGLGIGFVCGLIVRTVQIAAPMVDRRKEA
jgi:hypothetical protein